MKQTVSLILVVTVAVAVPLQAQRGQADSSQDWEHMRTLRPGTQIIVDAEGQGDARYEFVSAEGSALTIVTQAALNASPSDKRIIRNMTIKYSADLLAAQHGEFVNGDVRISGDDIFVKGRRIAGVPDVIERLQRAAVRQVRLDVPHPSPGRDAVLGLAIGAGIGLAFGAMLGCKRGERCDSPGIPQGLALVGGVIGVAIGTAVEVSRAPQGDVIYTAP
jgi:hypothetical protein